MLVMYGVKCVMVSHFKQYNMFNIKAFNCNNIIVVLVDLITAFKHLIYTNL